MTKQYYSKRPENRIKSVYRTAWDAEDAENSLKSCGLVVEMSEAGFTGLYDSEGNELHKMPNPIGFMRD